MATNQELNIKDTYVHFC